MVDDKTVKFTTSAGVSPFFGTENPVELISHATQALDLAILEGATDLPVLCIRHVEERIWCASTTCCETASDRAAA